MTDRDYYSLLDVERSAPLKEIERAFRKLARKLHPDINPGDEAAEVRYRLICEAYEVLSNPERRQRYDREGTKPVIPPPPRATGYGFAGFDFTLRGRLDRDIFPKIFRPRPEAERQGPSRGEDIEHRLTISFEESLSGLTASFQLSRLVACPHCQGWGEVGSAAPRVCRTCEGRGRLTQSHGHMLFTRPCGDCGGSGSIDRETCVACRGAARQRREETLSVRIPAGVDDGSRVAIPGKGNEGRGGGPAGDLYVRIHVLSHTFFHRKGDNLFCTVPVTFAEAALGCRIEVPTVEGSVRIRVPAGVQSGKMLRLSGRGAPSLRGEAKGDLFVTIQVVTPVVYDERSQELLRELARLHPENPREELERGSKSAGRGEQEVVR